MTTMPADEVRVGERRPGGRGARVRAAVLEATIAALAESSYDTLRIEDVAARAGVNKTTVYRRWPTKAELVAEATLDHSAGAVPMPDTGSLATDLRALARSVAANIGSATGGHLARTMIVAAATSDDVAAKAPDFWRTRLGLARTIIEHAVARGELHEDADANVIIESLIGPLYVRLLLTGERITRAFADQVADLVATGAMAKYSRPRSG